MKAERSEMAKTSTSFSVMALKYLHWRVDGVQQVHLLVHNLSIEGGVAHNQYTFCKDAYKISLLKRGRHTISTSFGETSTQSLHWRREGLKSNLDQVVGFMSNLYPIWYYWGPHDPSSPRGTMLVIQESTAREFETSYHQESDGIILPGNSQLFYDEDRRLASGRDSFSLYLLVVIVKFKVKLIQLL